MRGRGVEGGREEAACPRAGPRLATREPPSRRPCTRRQNGDLGRLGSRGATTSVWHEAGRALLSQSYLPPLWLFSRCGPWVARRRREPMSGLVSYLRIFPGGGQIVGTCLLRSSLLDPRLSGTRCLDGGRRTALAGAFSPCPGSRQVHTGRQRSPVTVLCGQPSLQA